MVSLFDSINQELRERRHDLSVLTEPEVCVSKERTAADKLRHV